ncbi:MAG: hypothetical protein RBG13Loki_1800 [Promethearchaeota archaeon CR_4]|nr:MAG: hypothetical protein RBG13Loki_1800 [Candidatus Lokiarchaeota archaeon CR_4]
MRLKINRLTFSFALILPDLVDKLLLWTIGTTGRDWAHNVFFVALVGVPFLVTRKFPLAESMWLGGLIHLVLDIPEVPWFFPFVSYDFPFPEYRGFWEYFIIGLTQPLTLGTELGGLTCMVWLIVKYRLFSRPGLTGFLKNTSAIKIETVN